MKKKKVNKKNHIPLNQNQNYIKFYKNTLLKLKKIQIHILVPLFGILKDKKKNYLNNLRLMIKMNKKSSKQNY